MHIKPINKYVAAYYPNGELDDKIVTPSGLELYKDTRFEPTFSIKDTAIAKSVSDKVNIPEGAFVYLSYLVSAEGATLLYKDEGGKCFLAKEDDIFMYENKGDIEAVGKWVIVDPIIPEINITTETGIIIPNEEKRGDEKFGIVVFVSDEVSDRYGVMKGDKVLLNKNAQYEFKFNGKKLYRVDSNLSLLAVCYD